MSNLEAELAQLRLEIPVSWSADYETFQKLTGAETTARNGYRRAADDAYESANEVVSIFVATEAYIALEGPLQELGVVIEMADFPDAEQAVKAMERIVRGISGADDVKKQLGKVKKSLGKRKLNREKALEDFQKVMKLYKDQIEWRSVAEGGLRGDIESYVNALGGTIGIRQQESLNREQALYLASCTAVHRDLSLNF